MNEKEFIIERDQLRDSIRILKEKIDQNESMIKRLKREIKCLPTFHDL